MEFEAFEAAARAAYQEIPDAFKEGVGGLVVSPGDLVCGDDDGLLIAAPDRLAEVVDAAEGIEAAERALVSAMRNGHDLHSLTTVVEHVAALRRGEPSALGFKV